MSGLFGTANPTTGATTATNTTGDISKDVTLSSPPEDSISEICFSPQTDHLAVASWDKKVRIYEINSNGQSEGKALFDHEGPVLSCHWSKVSYSAALKYNVSANLYHRMARKLSEPAPTKQPVCSTLVPIVRTQSKSPPTNNPSAAYASSISLTAPAPCSAPAPGIKPSNTGISVPPYPSRPLTAKSASTAWTRTKTCLSSQPQTGTSTSSISMSQENSTRRFRAR